MPIIDKILFLAIVTSTNVLASDPVATNPVLQVSWWEGSGKIIAATISFITIITMLAAFIKRVISSNNMEPRLDKAEKEIQSLKTAIETNYKDIKDLMHALRVDLGNKVNVTNYNELVLEHESLEETVNAEIEKLSETVNQLSHVELKLNNIKNQFDDNNHGRKEEIKEINETIKTLRENIREDINDIKAVIMKLMMNIKVKEND